MQAIGGLTGTAGGLGGSGFSAPSGTNSGQLQTAYGGAQTAMGNQNALLTALQGQNGLGNQNQVYGQLQGVANGTGPNPAQAMLNQSTGANVANQASLMAGQRGAAGNVGLMARQAAQQGANIQQQAAGQGASMQAQQSLNALNNAGQMANTMAANQIGQTNANVQAQQGEQATLQGANSSNNAIQGQLANTTMQGQQGLIGGGLQAAGAVMGMMAKGGMVGYADGGGIQAQSAFGPQSMFGQSLASPQQAPIPSFGGDNEGAKALQQGVSSFGKKKKSSPMSGATSMQDSDDSEFGGSAVGDSGASGLMGTAEKLAPLAIMAASKGGEVPAVVSPGERIIPPDKVKDVAQGKVSPMKVGAQVPGTPKVKGNSYKNDTVPAKLPAGGFVIPNNIMQSKDPEGNAAKFVRDYLAKKGKRA